MDSILSVSPNSAGRDAIELSAKRARGVAK